MTTIKLTPGPTCKCSCRQYNGSDNKKYWYDTRKEEVYSTDCHQRNPTKAIGKFEINRVIINQSQIKV